MGWTGVSWTWWIALNKIKLDWSELSWMGVSTAWLDKIRLIEVGFDQIRLDFN